jgi:hypothetical protein
VVVQKPIAKIVVKTPAEKTEEKKFKFVADAPAKNCDCDEKPDKSTISKPASSDKSDKEVIFLIKKDQQAKSENSISDNKIFKFNKGPEGKISKTIFKPKAEVKPVSSPVSKTEKPQEKVSTTKEKITKIEAPLTTASITKSEEKKPETVQKTESKPAIPAEATTEKLPTPPTLPTTIIPNSLSKVTPKFVIGILPPEDPRAKAFESSKNK